MLSCRALLLIDFVALLQCVYNDVCVVGVLVVLGVGAKFVSVVGVCLCCVFRMYNNIPTEREVAFAPFLEKKIPCCFVVLY